MADKLTTHGHGRARGRGRGDRPNAAPGAAPPTGGPPPVFQPPMPQPAAAVGGLPPPPAQARGGRGRAGTSQPAQAQPRPGPPAQSAQPRPGPPGQPAQAWGPQAQAWGPEQGDSSRSMAQARPVAQGGAEQTSSLQAGGGRTAARGPITRPGGDRELATQMEQVRLNPKSDGRSNRRGALAMNHMEYESKPTNIISKMGNDGKQVKVYANIFEVAPRDQFHIYQYHVDFVPEIPNQKARIAMLNELRSVFGVMVTDGMLLFLLKPLEKAPVDFFQKRKVDGSDVKITVKFSSEVQYKSNTTLQIYNMVFRRCLKMIGYQMIQRNYFNPKEAIDVPSQKMTVWPGYATAIGLYESRIALNVDVSHKLLRTTTVLDLINEQQRQTRQGGKSIKELFQDAIVGQIVLTRYNNRTYRIDDVDWDKDPQTTFPKRDGSRQSFVEYYRTSYSLEIRDFKQPLLVSMPTKKAVRGGQNEPILLVPELCTVTGLSESQRNNFRVMQDIASHTRLVPAARVQALDKLSRSISQSAEAQAELTNWNLKIASNMLEITARQLDCEKIFMRKEIDYDTRTIDWTGALKNTCLSEAVGFDKWLVVYPDYKQDDMSAFVNALKNVGRKMGMNIGEPKYVSLRTERRFISTSNYINEVKKHLVDGLQLVLACMPGRKDVYDALKCLLCVDVPVPSQVITERNVDPTKAGKFFSIATKVALQINCKLGGEAWTLSVPMSNAMVIGIDTFHDSMNKARSVVGVVASLNKNLTKYHTRTFLQNRNEELGHSLQNAISVCLKEYAKVNQALPQKIFVFRDGVGDGMLEMVKRFEIKQIQDGIKAFGVEYQPKLCVIVVKKRINQRFVTRINGQYQNPAPGTVIDTEATKPMWYDYFIISQSVNQGTVSPTHYNIIHDDGGTLNANQLQRLTYKLCHLYFNWPGTIRVPAPCQYAHKVAFLVGQSLHKEPHPAISNKLFYL